MLFPREGTPLTSPGLSSENFLTTWGGFPCFFLTRHSHSQMTQRLCAPVGTSLLDRRPSFQGPSQACPENVLLQQQTIGVRSRSAKWLPGFSHIPWDLFDSEEPLNMGQIWGGSLRYRQGQGRLVWGLLKVSILMKFSQPRCRVGSSSSPCAR